MCIVVRSEAKGLAHATLPVAARRHYHRFHRTRRDFGKRSGVRNRLIQIAAST